MKFQKMSQQLKIVLGMLYTVFLLGCIFNNDKESITDNPQKYKVEHYFLSYGIQFEIHGSVDDSPYDFWIFRDGQPVSPPVLTDSSDGIAIFTAIDSVFDQEEYKYEVKYGTTKPKNLIEPITYSKDLAKGWGRLSLSQNSQDQVKLDFIVPSRSHYRALRVERRIGALGDSIILDTLPINTFQHIDTNLVPLDTTLFYRFQIQDAITEEWLQPTSWDSIVIENKILRSTPNIDVETQGKFVEIRISLPRSAVEKVYLYRNTKDQKSGASKIDSLFVGGFSINETLVDLPNIGTHYYWIETVDKYNRTSTRSLSHKVLYTGNPKGPNMNAFANSSSVTLSATGSSDNIAYIFERTQDTTKSPTIIDTTKSSSYTDIPPSNGFWFYRARVIDKNFSVSDPGSWDGVHFNISASSGSFTPDIQNLGSYVIATSRYSSHDYKLYRSSSPNRSNPKLITPTDTDSSEFRDYPAIKGTYYYWFVGETSISETKEITYTGGPAINQLSKYSGRINVYLPSKLKFTTEIWTSSGNPTEESTWSLDKTVETWRYNSSSSIQSDTDASGTGFRHFKLRIVHTNGDKSEFGPIRSIYLSN